jgi:hypothetical protein
MELQKVNDLRALLRVACNDANRVDGLARTDDVATHEWQENVASCLDKLCTVTSALLEEAAPSKHAEAVEGILKPVLPGDVDPRD